MSGTTALKVKVDVEPGKRALALLKDMQEAGTISAATIRAICETPEKLFRARTVAGADFAVDAGGGSITWVVVEPSEALLSLVPALRICADGL